MWAFIVLSYSPTDTLYLLYSDDEGNNWICYTRSHMSYASIRGEIDAEIVQTSTGKFIYAVCELYFPGSGKQLIGLLITSTGSGSGTTFQIMSWPGEDQGTVYVKKNRPRITSDCAYYQYSSAWIYIVCCQDSSASGGYMTCVKAARINYPYDSLPLVTYKSEPFFYNDFVALPSQSYCDLAYFKDGSGESIMVLQSNVPVISNLYLTKSSIVTFASWATSAGILNSGTTRQKQFGYISSNGYYPDLMITNAEIYSATDNDIQFFNSVNGGLSWTTGYVDYSGYQSLRAEIMERKNIPGEFYLAYANFSSSFNTVHFCKATGNAWGTVVPQMNHVNTVASPHPCYRATGVDNCLAIWRGATDVWLSAGCSGSVVTNMNMKLNFFIQGRYNPNLDGMFGDTLTIQLRNNFSPYSVVGTAKSFQNGNGIGIYNSPTALNGTNYFIVIKHRNSIETWSRSPGQSFASNTLNYNFFTWAQAYGGNLVEVDTIPYRFGIYTGDVNQDAVVEAADVALVDNAAFNFVTGYVLTDLTGEGTVDGSDYLIADNNAANFISRIRP